MILKQQVSNGAVVEPMDVDHFQERLLMNNTIINDCHSVVGGVALSALKTLFSVAEDFPIITYCCCLILVLYWSGFGADALITLPIFEVNWWLANAVVLQVAKVNYVFHVKLNYNKLSSMPHKKSSNSEKILSYELDFIVKGFWGFGVLGLRVQYRPQFLSELN